MAAILMIVMCLLAVSFAIEPSPAMSGSSASQPSSSSQPSAAAQPMKKVAGEAVSAASKMVEVARSKLDHLKQTVKDLPEDKRPAINIKIDEIRSSLASMEKATDSSSIAKIAETLSTEQANLKQLLAAAKPAAKKALENAVEKKAESAKKEELKKEEAKKPVSKPVQALKPAKAASKNATKVKIHKPKSVTAVRPQFADPAHKPAHSKAPARSVSHAQEPVHHSLRDIVKMIVQKHRDAQRKHDTSLERMPEEHMSRGEIPHGIFDSMPGLHPEAKPIADMMFSGPQMIITDISPMRDEEDEEERPFLPLPHLPFGIPQRSLFAPGPHREFQSFPRGPMPFPLMGGMQLPMAGPMHENMQNPLLHLFAGHETPVKPPAFHDSLMQSLVGPMMNMLGQTSFAGGIGKPEVSMTITDGPKPEDDAPMFSPANEGLGMEGLTPFLPGANPMPPLSMRMNMQMQPPMSFHRNIPASPPGFAGIHENATHLEARFNIPMARKDQISVDVEKDQLTVEATMEAAHVPNMQRIFNSLMGMGASEEEEPSEVLEEKVTLPFEPEPKSVKAQYRNGVLTVALPKMASSHVLVE